MKILVVDDSKPMRTFLCYLVSELRFDTVQADDGQNALETIQQQPDFDLALVDWDMPRMNGLEFVKATRADQRFNHMKIMMVTTQSSMDRVTSALEAGATDFLMKPVTKETLEDKLRVLGVVD